MRDRIKFLIFCLLLCSFESGFSSFFSRLKVSGSKKTVVKEGVDFTLDDKERFPTYARNLIEEAKVQAGSHPESSSLSLALFDFESEMSNLTRENFLSSLKPGPALLSHIRNRDNRREGLPFFKMEIKISSLGDLIKIYSLHSGSSPRAIKMLGNSVRNEAFMNSLAFGASESCDVVIPSVKSWGLFSDFDSQADGKWLPFAYLALTYLKPPEWISLSNLKCPEKKAEAVKGIIIGANQCLQESFGILHNDLFLPASKSINTGNIMLNLKTRDIAVIDFGEATFSSPAPRVKELTAMRKLDACQFFKRKVPPLSDLPSSTKEDPSASDSETDSFESSDEEEEFATPKNNNGKS